MNKAIVLASLTLAVSPLAAFSTVHHETITLNISKIEAHKLNGPLDPSIQHNAYCQKQLSSYIKPLVLTYTINDITKMQSAVAQYSGTSVNLHPEGIATLYAFVSDGVNGLDSQKIYRVVGGVDLSFENGFANVQFHSQPDYNCAIRFGKVW